MKNYLLLVFCLLSTGWLHAQQPLADGQLYKIAVQESGIYKLEADQLRELGINLESLDPRQIKLLGNGGGMLPEYLGADYVSVPVEIPIWVRGEDDGHFDAGDAIFFYAEGPHRWSYTDADGYGYQNNIYSDTDAYFLKISPGNGQRIRSRSSVDGANYPTSTYDHLLRLEEDSRNVFHDWPQAQGSGKKWYGDYFLGQRIHTYDAFFRFSDRITDEPVKVTVEMILRANQGSRFELRINDQPAINSNWVSRISDLSSPIITFAGKAAINETVLVPDPFLSLQVAYPYPGSSTDNSEAWLDFIQLEARRSLAWPGEQMPFRDSRTVGQGTADYTLTGMPNEVFIWDVSDPLQPIAQAVSQSGSTVQFGAPALDLRSFVATTPATAATPELLGTVPQQNISGYTSADMIILYDPAMKEQVERFASHRAAHSNLSIATVTVEQVMNEYASGSMDPTAIRNYVRHLHQENNNFRYLLLFGDGSFDHRDRYGEGKNFVPVYETESLNPVNAFPSDDYYVILEDNTPANSLNGKILVSVGRLPVNSEEQARVAVDKIIRYDTDPGTFGNWRNRLVFVGDDEDGDQHSKDANRISNNLQAVQPQLNIEKIFLDAFPQISTPGGNRFPAATDALNKSIFKGVFAAVYFGHGGSKGWAQERVLNIEDILGWENEKNLPLFITATCTFAGYDDPFFTTAGEEVFHNPRGGAIALMTTVRAVFANLNAVLTQIVLEQLYEREPDGQVRTNGEIMQAAKNTLGSSSLTNARKFTLLGDPSQRMSIPPYKITTTHIDLHDVSDENPDTLRALQRVTIRGYIEDPNGMPFTGFNGEIYPTIFDKEVTVRTLAQDEGSNGINFEVQKNVIFKGKASVEAGHFEFTFVMPRDIDYTYGLGKISYYASDLDRMLDAAGSYQRIVIGGSDPNALVDDQGPEVEVFMNDEGFAFGGITGPNPTLVVKLQDDNGINVVGNSIGHDLEAYLDGNEQEVYLLNDFYESEKDDYRKGTVRFPLENLSDGRHTMRVKAWDVANNSAEGYTEFVVASDEAVALNNVFNYPNPFGDRTCFQFDHNLAGQELQVLIQIYTVSGRLVKSIEAFVMSDGVLRQDNCISWDGRDDYGDRLARGVYLYKVRVKAHAAGANALQGESAFEKLVLLR